MIKKINSVHQKIILSLGWFLVIFSLTALYLNINTKQLFEVGNFMFYSSDSAIALSFLTIAGIIAIINHNKIN